MDPLKLRPALMISAGILFFDGAILVAGLADFVFYSWYGLWGPAGLPAEVSAKLHTAAVQAVSAADVKDKLGALGFATVGGNGAEFSRYIDEEMQKYGKIVREAKIRAE